MACAVMAYTCMARVGSRWPIATACTDMGCIVMAQGGSRWPIVMACLYSYVLYSYGSGWVAMAYSYGMCSCGKYSYGSGWITIHLIRRREAMLRQQVGRHDPPAIEKQHIGIADGTSIARVRRSFCVPARPYPHNGHAVGDADMWLWFRDLIRRREAVLLQQVG